MCKKILLVLLIMFSCIFFMGFKKKERPVLILTSATVTNETLKYPEDVFSQGQKINFALLTQNGFDDDVLRLQIFSKSDKTSHWGFDIIQSRDIHINQSQYHYVDYIIVNNSGYYVLQFFNLKNLRSPIAQADFWIK